MGRPLSNYEIIAIQHRNLLVTPEELVFSTLEGLISSPIQMVIIRRVIPEEADELSRIALAAKRHWGYLEHWIELWMPQLMFDAEYFEANESWVAVEDEQLIAFYTLLDNHGIAWIENLWVKPEFMGKGIGKRLFIHALEFARQRGYKTLQLEADPNALGFYERMGMHKIGERHSEVDGQPRILPIMEMTV